MSAPTQTVYFYNPTTITTLENEVTQLEAQNVVNFDFQAVQKHKYDQVTVPDNYTWDRVISYGDPIAPGVSSMGNLGLEDYTSFDKRWGDHNDGLTFLGINEDGTPNPNSTTRGLLIGNHENNDVIFQHSNAYTGGFRTVTSTSFTPPLTGAYPIIDIRNDFREVIKEAYGIGMSVVEIYKDFTGSNGEWKINVNGVYNKRYHQLSRVKLAGACAGNNLLKTKFDPTGNYALGTKNNCGNGYTPWGTFLGGEENCFQYFAAQASATGYLQEINASDRLNFLRMRHAFGYEGLYADIPALISGGAASIPSMYWTCITGPDGAETIPEYAQEFINYHECTPVSGLSMTGDYRYALNTQHWIIEMDPFSPTGDLGCVKRTSLGRGGWENANIATPVAGKPIAVYLPDDSRSEYIFKYVSEALWDPADANVKYSTTPGARMAVGDKYLNTGTMYVAKFTSAGTGSWIELNYNTNILLQNAIPTGYYCPSTSGPAQSNPGAYTDAPGTLFTSQQEVLIKMRLAGDAVQATQMDRPEWVAIDPLTNVCYCTLTNSSRRQFSTRTNWERPAVDAANPRVGYAASTNSDGYVNVSTVPPSYLNTAGTANPASSSVTNGTSGNPNGHIIRWLDVDSNGDYDPSSTIFNWDIYAFGSPAMRPFDYNISRLSDSNDFSSPDGAWFSHASNALFINTDDADRDGGLFSTNNQCLVSIPDTVFEGKLKTVQNRNYATNGTYSTNSVLTKVGSQPRLRRLMVGPLGCEITGFAETAQGEDLFLCVQHPGESSRWDWKSVTPLYSGGLQSTWPYGGTNRPRSSVIVINKRDNQPGPIGLNKPRTL